MAKSFCKAQVLGSVGADPAITTLGNCRLMASIHIAVAVTLFDATVSQNVERIVWHRIVGFGFHAENIRDNITKGCRVYAEGVPFPYTWEDRGGRRNPAIRLLFLSSLLSRLRREHRAQQRSCLR